MTFLEKEVFGSYKLQLKSLAHGENEAAIESDEYYTLSKYALNLWISIEWKGVITMQYCNRG